MLDTVGFTNKRFDNLRFVACRLYTRAARVGYARRLSGLRHNVSVEEVYYPVGYIGIELIMGNHDDGCAILVKLCQQAHDLHSVLGIEVTCRLIGENQFGVEDNSTGYSHALLLSAGELVGKCLARWPMLMRFITSCTRCLRSAFGMPR